jgi:hypothetical protein
MKYISTLLVALTLTATAAQAQTSVEFGSGTADATKTTKSEDFYSLRIKNSMPVGGGFSVIPELRLDSGNDSGKTVGNAKLGVYHDVLVAGPATVGARVNLVENFGTAGRNEAWSIEPNVAFKAGQFTVGAAYEYGAAFDKGVAADVRTSKFVVSTPVNKKIDVSLKYEDARGDFNKKTTFIGLTTKF